MRYYNIANEIKEQRKEKENQHEEIRTYRKHKDTRRQNTFPDKSVD